MPVLRSQKTTCFSCGKSSIPGSSAQKHPNGRISFFVCPHCEAENHRDPNGEIVDYVPATPKRAVPSYAHRVRPRSTPPASPAFCMTCLHNQQIVRGLLNQFPLPSEDDPNYRIQAEVKLPAYLRELEERYPQVCDNCEPKVSQKIRKSNYAAKAATLAAMRARTDAAQREKPNKAAGRVLTIAWGVRGVVWAGSHLLFLAWHISAALHPTGGSGMVTPTVVSCVADSYRNKTFDPSCYNVTARLVQKYGLLSLLGFFWIYRQRQAELNPSMKLIGVNEYFRLEVATASIRLFAWMLLTPGAVRWTVGAFQRAHIAMSVLSVLAFLYAITCLRLEQPPSFSLRESGYSEISVIRADGSTAPPPVPSTTTTMPPPTTIPKRHFLPPAPPVRLTPSSSLTDYRDRPRTESPEPSPARSSYDPDAMDWTPQSSPLRQPPLLPPQHTYGTSTFGPSPFASAPTLHAARYPQTNLFAKPPRPPSPPPVPQPFQFQTRQPAVPVLRPARFHPPAPRDDSSDNEITSLLSGRLRLADDDNEDDGYNSDASTIYIPRSTETTNNHNSNNPNHQAMDTESEPLFALILRLFLMVGICYFAIPQPRLWPAPALFALVWRAGTEYPDLGMMTIISAAVMAGGGGWCAMYNDDTPKAMEMGVDTVGAVVAGVVALGEVWGFLMRAGRDRRRKFWREEAKAEAVRGSNGAIEKSGGAADGSSETVTGSVVTPAPAPAPPVAASVKHSPRKRVTAAAAKSALSSPTTAGPGGGGMYVERRKIGGDSSSSGGGSANVEESPRSQRVLRPRDRLARNKSMGGMMSGLSL